MRLLRDVFKLSLICLWLALFPAAATAQEAGNGAGENGFRKVVSLPNDSLSVLSNKEAGIHAPARNLSFTQSSFDTESSAQPSKPARPLSPPAHAQITVPAPPPPPPCPGIGGGCQLLVVGRSGPGTILESLRDPNNPDAPGGSLFVDLTMPPAPEMSPIAGRLNLHSTRVDRVAVARRAVDNLWRGAPLPNINLGINPDPGLVGIWHWFWVKNYQGEPLVFPLHLELPWTLSWQERLVDTFMECDDDTCQTRHAVTTSHLEDHSTSYVDTIDVSVTLTPAEFHWDFGDGARGSEQPFDPVTGLGRVYTDPYTESPVKWFYEFDSRDFVGGFPVTLRGRWTGTYRIESTSTFDGPYNESGTLGGNRDGTWQARHVVCQVQALNIAPGFKPADVPCRDPRVGS